MLRVLLANSITLTPGTITVSLEDDTYVVHALDKDFAVIGEEFGFLGTCIVVLLVFLIALRILRIAMKASDVSGRVIAAGMAAWIGFQGFMNIAVAVGLIPNTGIPLPFVSYGLTSLLSLYLGVGFVLNVYMQGRKR